MACLSPVRPRRLAPAALPLFALLALGGCGGDSETPTDPGGNDRIPSSLAFGEAAVSVDDGAVVRLSVTVRDQDGNPFTSLPQGVSVSWSVADASLATVEPVGAGLQADLTAQRVGSTQVTASVGTASAQASVEVNQVATELVLVSGDEQSGSTGSVLGEPLIVRVADRHGDGVPGITVGFGVTSGEGSVSPATATTDAEGLATAEWTLGAAAGEQGVQAEVAGLAGSPLEFRATAEAEAPTGTVEGVVTAANGTTPIQGALVRLFVDGGAVASVPETVTDTQGRYTLEGVPAGDQILLATRGVFRAEIPVSVTAGATVEAPVLALDATNRIAYVPGVFDSIEDIVRDELGTELDEIRFADLADPEVTSRYDFIFVNCGSLDFAANVESVADNLRDYISGGGALYISDLELELAELIFPDEIVGGVDGNEGTVTADVVSPRLRAFLPGTPQTVDVVFNLEGWDGVTELSSAAEVLLSGDYIGAGGPVQDEPLAFSIALGEGELVYTSFHNNAVATADQVAVLMFFIFDFGDAAAGGAPAVDLSTLRLGSEGTAPVLAPSLEREHRNRRPHQH